MITSEQMKAARALLRWEQKDIAALSGISLATIKRLETKHGLLGGTNVTVTAVVRAFEAAGIEFSNGAEPGVKLRKPAA